MGATIWKREPRGAVRMTQGSKVKTRKAESLGEACVIGAVRDLGDLEPGEDRTVGPLSTRD